MGPKWLGDLIRLGGTKGKGGKEKKLTRKKSPFPKSPSPLRMYGFNFSYLLSDLVARNFWAHRAASLFCCCHWPVCAFPYIGYGELLTPGGERALLELGGSISLEGLMGRDCGGGVGGQRQS